MISYARLTSQGTPEENVLRSVNGVHRSFEHYDTPLSVELPSTNPDVHEFLTLFGYDGLFNDVFQRFTFGEDLGHEAIVSGSLADDLTKIVRGATIGAGFSVWSARRIEAAVPFALEERIALYRDLLDVHSGY